MRGALLAVLVAACSNNPPPQRAVPAQSAAPAAPTATGAPVASAASAASADQAPGGGPCGGKCKPPEQCLTVAGHTRGSSHQGCWIPCATDPCPAGTKCTMIHDGPGMVCVK